MKRLLIAWLVCAAGVNLYGQGGTIPFRNDNTSLVMNSLTGARVVAGNTFLVSLNVAPDGQIDPRAFVQIGGSVGFYLPGLFDGGSRTVTIPSPGPGSEYVMVQIKVWEAAYGTSFEAAVAAPEQNGRLALRGTSAILRVRLCTPVPPCLSLSQQGLRSIVLTVPDSNTPPTISAIPAQTVSEDTALGPIAFTVQDAQTAPENLIVTAASSNPSLIRSDHITLGGAGMNRTVRLEPEPDRFGTATITLVVADSDGATATNAFSVTVTPVNDPPEISAIPNQTINENSSGVVIPFTVRDVETSASDLIVNATSSNTQLVANASLVLAGTGTNRTVTVVPAANRFGQTTVTIQATDSAGASTTRAFSVTVVPVLHVRKDGDKVIVSWTALNALLQSTDDPSRDWNDVLPRPSSPYLAPISPCGFYRLREN